MSRVTSRLLALSLAFAWVIGCELNPQPDLPSNSGSAGALNTGGIAAGGKSSASEGGDSGVGPSEGGSGATPSEGGSGAVEPQGGTGNEAGAPAVEGGAAGENMGGAAGENPLGSGGND